MAEELEAKPASVERTIQRMREAGQVVAVGTAKPQPWGLAR